MADLTPTPLDVEVSRTDTELVLRVVGELDMASSPRLAAAVAGVADTTIVVEMSGVTFMDSAGLAVFVNAIEAGNTVVLRDPTAAVRRLIEVTGLTETIRVDGDAG